MLQYKREADVPSPLRRAITRSAALLEIVDLEFERVLAEREEYTSEIDPNNLSVALNADTLRKSLRSLLPKENAAEDEEFSELLDELKFFKITNIGHLKGLLDETRHGVLGSEKSMVASRLEEYTGTGEVTGTTKERIERNVFFTHTGLTRQALIQKHGMKPIEEYRRALRNQAWVIE